MKNPSTVRNLKEAKEFARKYGYPVVVRASFSLGTIGEAIVNDQPQLETSFEKALESSPVGEVSLTSI